jgi:hypothetical protein
VRVIFGLTELLEYFERVRAVAAAALDQRGGAELGVFGGEMWDAFFTRSAVHTWNLMGDGICAHVNMVSR